MIKRDEITHAIYDLIGRDLLEKAWQKDEVANGVQIEGSKDVSKIALGVSLNLDFLNKAIKGNVQYCIFHHGLDPRTYLSRLPLYLQKELKLIFNHQLTIAGFHYTLDAHPIIGNNAQIIQKLGAQLGDPLFDEWGYVGKFDKALELNIIKERCYKLFNHEIISFESSPKKITTIGVVSGAGKPYAGHLAELEDKGVELFISGETSESIPHKFLETGINYFVCGHYATETFGVKALGDKLRTHFGNKLEVEFIDLPSVI
jgi:dinuclear metal center YbgI/SA1388 family protein